MMKEVIKYLAVLLFVLFAGPALTAQEKKIEKGEAAYEAFAYIDAIAVFEEVAEAGHATAEVYAKLGNAHYFNANYVQAEKWYAQLFLVNETPEPIYYLRYSQVLKANGNTAQGIEVFEKYQQAAAKDKEAGTIDFRKLIAENSDRYEVINSPYNSTGRDFGARLHQEELYFSSTRDTGVVRRTINNWDGLSFLDIYSTDGGPGNQQKSVKKLRGDVNSKGHESTAIFTRDGNTMYFTRNATEGNGSRLSKIGQNLKIYRATLQNGKWQEVEALSINSDEYSTAHPALNESETLLYFSSDRPGGMGQSDLYSVEINEDGSLGTPKNLGSQINTIGRETFPALQGNTTLFFASDGHYGLGGLDVYRVELGNSLGETPINIGSPVNSSSDDFAYYPHTATTGYFSSDRPGGKGLDDIYSFQETAPFVEVFQQRIFGKVIDEETELPLADAQISIRDLEQAVLASVETDGSGNYEVVVPRFTSLLVRAEKKGYYSEETPNVPGDRDQEINFELERNIFELYEGDDLARALGIETIYFDLDRSAIRPDAARELEKVVAAMKKYPQLKIEVRSHTDSRASEQYNLLLSEKRAAATVDYLVEAGISSNRLTHKGFGEGKPVNQCTDGNPCSEEAHQANRRSEFILVAD